MFNLFQEIQRKNLQKWTKNCSYM